MQWICASRRVLKIKSFVAQTTNANRWAFMKKIKLAISYSCSDTAHHEHKTKIGAWLCGRYQAFLVRELSRLTQSVGQIGESMSDKSDAVDAFKIICPPKDENALDREWLEMCGFFVKGWLAKSAQQSAHPTPESGGEKPTVESNSDNTPQD